MLDYQREFLDFTIEINVLRFGDFTLKSGRQSPYFFNSGLFNTGRALAKLGDYYAHAIEHSAIDYHMLFGPAYKGIPLVAAASIALANHYQRDIPYAFNRKETKDHGEGGITVGAALEGRVLIVDDVISAGTSVGESVQIINAAGATPAGVVIALDRQERGKGDTSAIQEVEQRHGMPVVSIVKLEHLIEYLQEQPDRAQQLASIRDYQQRYGVK